MWRHISEVFDINIQIFRFHNVYGSYGSFDGGREKAHAAICRKAIQYILTGNHSIENSNIYNP